MLFATLLTCFIDKFQEDLAKMGVMIRHYDKKELKGYIRISVGKPEHTDALMKGLNALQL
jgi:histidinol-phosphate aminotransferase